MKQGGYSRGRLKLCLNHKTCKHCPFLSYSNFCSFSTVVHLPFCFAEGTWGTFQPDLKDSQQTRVKYTHPAVWAVSAHLAKTIAQKPWITVWRPLAWSTESLNSANLLTPPTAWVLMSLKEIVTVVALIQCSTSTPNHNYTLSLHRKVQESPSLFWQSSYASPESQIWPNPLRVVLATTRALPFSHWVF